MKISCQKTIITTSNETVHLTFNPSNRQISALLVDTLGTQIPIKPENLPREFRKITSPISFHRYFMDAYIKAPTLNNGDRSLHICQRCRGGKEDEELDIEEELDLIEKIMSIVKAGTTQLTNEKIKENVVMFVGKTGVGKSLLGNLLSDIQLVGEEDELEFRFTAKKPIFPFSDSNIESCTGCPIVFSPQQKDYTFIDPAGFDDTRFISHDVANAFFRKSVLEKAKLMKFVFVVNEDQIVHRGPEFADTFNSFLQLLGIINIKNKSQDRELTDEEYYKLERLAHSMTFVITQAKVGDNRKVRELYEKKLRAHLDAKGPLSCAAKTVLRIILDQQKWDVFSKPTTSGICPKTTQEKMRIQSLIQQKSSYLSALDTTLNVTVNDKYIPIVEKELLSYLEKAKEHFADKLKSEIIAHLQKYYLAISTEQALQKLQKKFHAAITSKEAKTLTELLESIKFRPEMFATIQQEAKAFDHSLQFLNGLLPDDHTDKFPIKRDWLADFDLRKSLVELDTMLIEMTKECEPTFNNGLLRLSGYFPKTSQITKVLSNYQNVTQIEIHGINRVLIDEDIVYPGCNVTIICPRWEIRNRRTINLSGQNGDSSKNSGAAAAGSKTGDNGSNGAPGENGTSAGHFMGFGQVFSNIDKLTIQANGGNGAKGQDGGAGHDGQDGDWATAKHDFIDDQDDVHKRDIVESKGWDFVGKPFHHGRNFYDTLLTNYGKPGTPGGNGGQGGAGGKPGEAGSIDLFSLTPQTLLFASSTNNGSSGKDGEPGTGGVGGRRGPDWTGVWHTGHNPVCGWNGHHLPHHTGWGAPADSGSSPAAKNSTGQAAVTVITKPNTVTQIYHFRESAIRASNIIAIRAIEAFRDDFDSLARYTNKATADTFYYECERMEQLFLEIEDKKKLLPLYRWMGERLQAVQVPNPSKGDAALLQCLYTATLSKIMQITASADSRLIIDIETFLKIVKNNIEHLHKLDHATKIEFYKDQYISTLSEKIKQADAFLQILTKDIQHADSDIDKEIKKMVAEIQALKDQNLSQCNDIHIKRTKLKELMARRKLLGGLTLIAQCIGCCFPPLGPVIAAVASTTLTMINNPQTAGVMVGQTLATYATGISGVLSDPKTAKFGDAHNMALQRLRDYTMTCAAINAMDAPGSSEDEQLAAMEKALKELNDQRKQLDAFKEKIQTDIKGSLHSIVKNADSLQKALQGMPKVALEFSRLAVKREFENIKNAMKKLTTGLKTADGIVAIASQLEEAIQTSANIYEHIQEYQERAEFAQYLAQLAAPTAQDPRITKFKEIAQRNLILEQYSRAFAAVKQWAFPFAALYLGDCLNIKQFIEAQTLDDFMKHIEEQLRLLRNKVRGNIAEIRNSVDPLIWSGTFTRNVKVGPFYKWSAKDHKNELVNLLRGRSTVLLADIRKTDPKLAAVKCKQVELRIVGKTPDLRERLQSALHGVRVRLEHSGRSYYQYEGQLYLMENDSGFTLSYQIGANEGETEGSNEVYNKMKKGGYMLSPYTNWAVSLDTDETLYAQFKNDLDDIEVHLVGSGQYVYAQKAKEKGFSKDLHTENRVQKKSVERTAPRNATIHLDDDTQNAESAKNSTSYWYQASDIHAIVNAPAMGQELAHVHFIQGMQGVHLEKILDEVSRHVQNNRPVVCVYNLDDLHWVTFALVQHGQNGITALYKDSFGGENREFNALMAARSIRTLCHTGKEQIDDGSSCGIFALQNMRLIAKGLKTDAESFIRGFETFTFCSLQDAKQLRLTEFARLYREGIDEIARQESVRQTEIHRLVLEHQSEVHTIITELTGIAPARLTFQSQDLAKNAKATIVVQIGADSAENGGYHYRIERSKDVELGLLQDLLTTSVYGWKIDQDYRIEDGIIKITTKIPTT